LTSFFEGAVASIDELKIKEDAEAQFATQADQKLLGDVTEFLIESTKFDLPTNFLKMVTNCGEKNYLLKKQKLNMYVLKRVCVFN
jgi:trigger factor